MKNEVKHLAHSSYRCEYHIVFAPKYRRKAIYGQLRKDIGVILRKLCEQMKVEIRGRIVPRPRTYASEHPAVYECSTVCRDAQVEECADDLRPARKSEVQIWEQKFLV